ncbi:TnsA endonuclease N-terminal domain-containing protein [Methylobacterium sp. E-045]|uniref:TnsA endonuclease N-terminal domain-containing protein n=1 Tax=Methylobacterium sp. E-045 TaxID=2836575 RepID=UPI001FBBA464|nr:TnsA endonuclease N-terminal domain-containing protein [Methylobacterium sp. E-045]MCJ2128014.1 TnsA endonuclease N-terminal domain-containing protein [Methylobacterium sp. E-045]
MTTAKTSAYACAPEDSRASRSTIRPSRGSARVTIIAGTPPREIRLESNLEANVAYIALADRRIADVLEQPPAIDYEDAQGRSRRHTFDFLFTTTEGTRILVAVKPSRRAEAKDLKATLRQIARHIPPSTADKVLLVTEKNFDRDTVHNAKLIHAVRRDPDPDAEAVVITLVDTLNGIITIDDLVKATGIAARAFSACVRLIDREVLIPIGLQRIDYQLRVVRAPTLAQGVAA